MKKIVILFWAFLPLSMLYGQTVVEDNFSQAKIHYEMPSVAIDTLSLSNSVFIYASLDGYRLGGKVGSPALPVRIDALTVPFCDSIELKVENAVYDTLLSPATLRWLPLQPPLSKRQRGIPTVNINEEVYATDSYVAMPLASVEVIGVARDRRLAQVAFSPVSINPVTGSYVVCRSADIVVKYIAPDSAATLNHYLRYRSPAFQTPSLNQLMPDKLIPVKSVRTTAPLRMVIAVPNALRCRMLDRFVEWKRKQGLMVDVINTTSSGLTTAQALAGRLRTLYTSATPTQPAPTYLLIVGDHNQVPAFNSKITYDDFSDHITDLYFATWSSDDLLPDCLQGRFSATDTNQLANIIRKTLLYESYAFPDDGYLQKAVLIAGVDEAQPGDYAYSYADPTMDYAARQYVNASNGFSSVYYYKNDTAFAPAGVALSGSSQNWAAASSLSALYDRGIGWVNYSAHGDWNKWYSPSFTAIQAGNMSNLNMPSFMIGNCCLSNKFDKPTCFGESLLRRGDNAGAVAYIGATNSTYWAQDFYWSVGVRTGIYGRMNTAYNSNNQGMYDGLFHTHNESFSNRAVTAGAMVMKGNMAVQLSSSQYPMKPYYWEIYELMGDPSLMPWLGKAKTMHFAADTTVRPILVQAPPHAYVAVVDTTTLEVVAAAFTKADGTATIDLPDGINLEATNYSVTAHGYRPYFSKFAITNDEFEVIDAPLECYPNPATTYCTVKCNGMKWVNLYNSRGVLCGEFQPTQGQCYVSLEGLPRGVYFLQVQVEDGYKSCPLLVQ